MGTIILITIAMIIATPVIVAIESSVNRISKEKRSEVVKECFMEVVSKLGLFRASKQ